MYLYFGTVIDLVAKTSCLSQFLDKNIVYPEIYINLLSALMC